VNLRELFENAARDLAEAEATTSSDGAITWARDGRAFSVLSADGSVAEFALDPPVAAAAARTPDVSPSLRGGEWVLFRPTVLDDHAADRATAWFASAHRHVARR
jgi:hypothetical protein